MHPDLFTLGPLTIHSYGLLVAIGLLAALMFLNRNSASVGLTQDQMSDLILTTTISGFVGARLFYVLYDFEYFRENPADIIAIWKGGIIFYGGVLFGLLGFLIQIKKLHANFFKLLDVFTPALALAHGFGRIGCFLNGCCYGKETTCFLGVHFPFLIGIRHPVELYESFFCFALFGFLILYRAKWKRKDGDVSLVYFSLYSAGRFVLEFFRGDMPLLAFGLTMAQWMSIAVFLISIFFMFKRAFSHAR